jgi:DNA polymerase III sliding clamp (beta) subunit (PCNA family)
VTSNPYMETQIAFTVAATMEATIEACDIPSIIAKLSDGIPLNEEERISAAAFMTMSSSAMTRVMSSVEALTLAATSTNVSYPEYAARVLPAVKDHMRNYIPKGAET